MATEWKKVRLDEMGTISRGRSKHRPRNDPSLFDGKYPFIQTADVKNANLYISEYSQTYNEKGLSQSKLWQPGTLCITIAANIADTGILSIPACFPDSVMGFIPFKEVSDARYVKYCFDILQRECKAISVGAAQDNLSWDKLSRIQFPCPPLETQQKIAGILSAYDDLIENNRKQIKLLEEAAQKLYKEWFVKLNFPGHENVKIVDGVPEEWKKVRAEDYFEVTIGKTPPRNETKWFSKGNIGKKWISIADMGNSGVFIFQTSENLTNEAIESKNVKIIPANTVLLSFKLTVGRVSITTEEMTTNEAIAHFVTDNKFIREYIYLYLKNFHYDYLGSTSAISTAINSKIVKSMPIIIPPESLLEIFSKLVAPYFDKIKSLQNQIQLLQSARDKLLPKLMNGDFKLDSETSSE